MYGTVYTVVHIHGQRLFCGNCGKIIASYYTYTLYLRQMHNAKGKFPFIFGKNTSAVIGKHLLQMGKFSFCSLGQVLLVLLYEGTQGHRGFVTVI